MGITLLGLVAVLVTQPLAVGMAAVGLAITLPAVAWLDRAEPEPWRQKVQAFLWGACVATFTAGLLNAWVASIAGGLVAAVVCAPIVEEGLKIAGVRRLVSTGHIDSPIDGIVYASYCALGFAAVENVAYLADAQLEGQILAVFVARVLLSPFAHPLFTMWAGKRIGEAAQGKIPMAQAVTHGWILAALLHAAWNLSASIPELMLIAVPAFVFLFFRTIRHLKALKEEEHRMVGESLPRLAATHGLDLNGLRGLYLTMHAQGNGSRVPGQGGRLREQQIALRRLAYRKTTDSDAVALVAQLRLAQPGGSQQPEGPDTRPIL